MSTVAIICGAGIMSGKEVAALELGEGMQEAGAEVHFVTSRWGNGEFARRAQAAGFPTDRLWLGFISATLRWDCIRMTLDQLRRWPSLLINYGRFLRRVIPRYVIHTNWHHLLLLWPFLGEGRDLFWVHDVVLDTRQYRRLYRFLEPRLKYFVAVSHAVAASLRKIGVSENKIRITHTGIKDPARGMIRMAGDEVGVKVGIVGQIGPWKGHDDLLTAFAEIVPSFRSAQLHVFGRGSIEYESFLKERAVALGIADRITWHGFVDDLATIYRSIDVCVMPSRCAEALGMVAVEASFFGVPVIAARTGGLPEVIEDKATGLLVEPGNVPELSSALEALLANRTLREEMGKQAQLKMAANFSRERFVGDFLRLLKAA